MRPEAVEQLAQLLHLLVGNHLGGHGRGCGLENPPHSQQFEHRGITLEIDDKAWRLKQHRRFQAGHVRAVASADVSRSYGHTRTRPYPASGSCAAVVLGVLNNGTDRGGCAARDPGAAACRA